MNIKITLDATTNDFNSRYYDLKDKNGDYVLIDTKGGMHQVHKSVLMLNTVFKSMFDDMGPDPRCNLPLPDLDSYGVESLIKMIYDVNIEITTLEQLTSIITIVDRFMIDKWLLKIKEKIDCELYKPTVGRMFNFNKNGENLEGFVKMRHKFIEEIICKKFCNVLKYHSLTEFIMQLKIEIIEIMLDTFTTSLWNNKEEYGLFVIYLHNLLRIKNKNPETSARIFKKFAEYQNRLETSGNKILTNQTNPELPAAKKQKTK
jgi:hypothetical protein